MPSGFYQTAKLRRDFASQFVPNGDVFVYRYKGRGEPRTVTRQERNRLVHHFNDRIALAADGLPMGGLGLAGLLIFAHNVLGVPVPWILIPGTALGSVFGMIIRVHWLWREPLRRLGR